MQSDPDYRAEVEQTFLRMVQMQIPVVENVSFTFLLENVSVALREQLVRHRIGVRVGERVGFDLAPTLQDSTFWAQSMRILSMASFADREGYDVPDSIRLSNRSIERTDGRVQTPLEYYEIVMREIQRAYNRLVEAGIPMEDARNVIPLGATHRITWTLNLGALLHILGKRGCWILQLGLWEPLIRGIVERLAEEVHPIFRELVCPPCIGRGTDEFNECHFAHDNERRLRGDDALPPCSLWLNKTGNSWVAENDTLEDDYLRKVREYESLWRRDPNTGIRK